MLEDFVGVPLDAYFANIVITDGKCNIDECIKCGIDFYQN